MMLMRWDVSLDLKTSKDGAHFMFLGITFHSFRPRTAKEWSYIDIERIVEFLFIAGILMRVARRV